MRRSAGMLFAVVLVGRTEAAERRPAIHVPGDRRTIQEAVAAAGAGDTVQVQAGEYQEDVRIARGGSEGKPLRVMAKQGARVVVRSITVAGAEWVEVAGFTVIGPKRLPAAWKDMPETVVDNPKEPPINPAEKPEVREPKYRRRYATYMAAWDAYNGPRWSRMTAGILVAGAHHVTIRDCEVSRHTIGIQLADGAGGLTIERNRAHHCRDAIWSWRGGGTGASVSDSVIRGNRVSQNLSAGIALDARASGVLVEENVSEFNGIGHFALMRGATRCLLRGNTGTHAGYYCETMEYPGGSGINLWTAGAGNVVEGNMIAFQLDLTRYDGSGLIVDGVKEKGQIIRNNVLRSNMGSGISLTESPGQVVSDNTCAENGLGQTDASNGFGIRVSNKRPGDGVNNVITGNVLSRNASGGIGFGGTMAKQRSLRGNRYLLKAGTPAIRDGKDERAGDPAGD